MSLHQSSPAPSTTRPGLAVTAIIAAEAVGRHISTCKSYIGHVDEESQSLKSLRVRIKQDIMEIDADDMNIHLE